MDWKTILPTCFGTQDLQFAAHPLDEGRARDMISEARGIGSTDQEIRQEVETYMKSKGLPDSARKAQMDELDRLLGKT